ncbi:MAG: DUF559 domain-containing protein [Alphaproteobacteria bacterium]|nr:DUF559 domain-containing protein [Alphaproteobacteria bacterium]
MRDGASRDDWIPSPVKLGAPLPLTASEIAGLYNTNAQISVQDEREISRCRPDIDLLITPEQFRSIVAEIHVLSSTDLRFRDDLWTPNVHPHDPDEFDHVFLDARKAIDFLKNSATWELEAIQAGRDGEKSRRVWESLLELIEVTSSQIEECHQLVMEFGPHVSDPRTPDDLLGMIEEVIDHQKSGRPFGLLLKVTKRRWFEFFQRTTVNGGPIAPHNINHLRAVRALLRIRQLRSDLLKRWDRQMGTKGAIQPTNLGERPEHTCRQFVPRITSCLDWYNGVWRPLETSLESMGFKWGQYFNSTAPHAGEHAELQRLRAAVMGELDRILQSRVCLLRYRMLNAKLKTLSDRIGQAKETDAAATTTIRSAIADKDVTMYDQAFRELSRLHYLEPEFVIRRELLDRLRGAAPSWASSIQNRAAGHEGSHPPGEAQSAWVWRQLHDELERRAAVSINKLQQEIEQASLKLLDVTTGLIDRQTWLRQIQHVNQHPDQKRALAAYTTLRGRLTKTGTGKRDAEFRAAARIQLALAKDAVPVWIMPLSEAAVSFDPRESRFDVVIIDEASQCDPISLFALYLGKSILIVGDDEQVTPLAVGQQSQTINDLIHVHLGGIPNKELYSGDTSIYELAQIAFGGIIRLTEHFRCAPDIIAFSNNLSYGGQIRPLREASSVPISPHVVPYRVAGGAEPGGAVNEQEAEVVASLMCSAMEQPEFKQNDKGTECSFGAVSLVGEKQAIAIDALLRQHLDPVEYRRRQVLCGDAAQFQGDERDVMFLSMVDAAPESPPLAMRQEGPKNVFKKRFNVAASRARNQMWVVHSLQYDTDLQIGDYRRRLIEHAIDPGRWKRDLDARLARVDPRSKEFQGIVLRRLVEKGFNVVAEYPAGAFSIDLVVIGEKRRLAIECDGEQFHGPEKLQDDIERQTVLERLGWKFVRIRGSLFFRDEARALRPVFERLNELGIGPSGPDEPAKQAQVSELVTRIELRASELRAQWQSESDAATTYDGARENPWSRQHRRFLRA